MRGRSRLNGSGVVLITAIIILSFLSVLGMSLISFLFSRISVTRMNVDRLKAFYLAEAGIAQSLWELRIDDDVDGGGIGNILKTSLGDGQLWATHNFQTATITATGEVNGIQRTVQITYSGI